MHHRIIITYVTMLMAYLSLYGCAKAPADPIQGTRDALVSFADDFYDAVSAHDADRVYRMIVHDDMDPAFFKSRFDMNYPVFLEYALRLKDEASSGNIGIHAQRQSDPCGSPRLVPDHQNQWKLQTVPGSDADASVEARKTNLISRIQTRQFMALLDTYALAHPELDAAQMRDLKRYLAYHDIPAQSVTFSGPIASVRLEDKARLYLICSANGWSLSQCIFTP